MRVYTFSLVLLLSLSLPSLVSLVSLLSDTATVEAATVDKKIALVYNGKFADADATKALATTLTRNQFEINYFSHPKEIIAKIKTAKLLAIGGTIDEIDPFVTSFSKETVTTIKDFINNGGLYLGICGGGFLASTGWKEESTFVKALSLVPFESDSYIAKPEPKVINVKWKNVNRSIYYQFGPKFLPSNNMIDKLNIKIHAQYDDNSIAACSLNVGQGRVYLIGPHPEADQTWIDESVENESSWKSTVDLSDDMIKDLTLKF
ncbi:MAG: hypothetical protein HQK49_16880 [Oligoflexia bacterium]|nr:hypothetical protein [Oligoflexia bacterium]